MRSAHWNSRKNLGSDSELDVELRRGLGSDGREVDLEVVLHAAVEVAAVVHLLTLEHQHHRLAWCRREALCYVREIQPR